ncbi:hypothetical protein PMIN03_002999 [Paraphaeosphaeria minitans]
MVLANVDYAIEITQCYGQQNLTLCNEFPSNLTISDVTKEFRRHHEQEVRPFRRISGLLQPDYVQRYQHSERHC